MQGPRQWSWLPALVLMISLFLSLPLNVAHWDRTGIALAQESQPTNTPRPDGSIVYVVQSGDTPFAIAQQYGLTIDQLRNLNNLRPSDFIFPGQQLIVRASRTSPSTPAAPPPATPTPVSAATAAPNPVTNVVAPGKAQVCIIVYEDRDGNGRRDSGDPLLKGAPVEVAQNGSILASGPSLDTSPLCLPDLDPGSYTVLQRNLTSYKLTTVPEWLVPLAAGQSITVEFGDTPTPDQPATPTPAGASVRDIQIRNAALISSSLVVVLLLIGTALMLFLRRTWGDWQSP